MRSKNQAPMKPDEIEHVSLVKSLPCSVCDHPGPSDAHHFMQGWHSSCIALCKSCHQGDFNGIHGQRRMWHIKKLDELKALCITIKRLIHELRTGRESFGQKG